MSKARRSHRPLLTSDTGRALAALPAFAAG